MGLVSTAAIVAWARRGLGALCCTRLMKCILISYYWSTVARVVTKLLAGRSCIPGLQDLIGSHRSNPKIMTCLTIAVAMMPRTEADGMGMGMDWWARLDPTI